MSKKQQLPPHLAEWAQARARFRLSDADVQMARELGMNPKRLGGKANHDQEPWKAPLPDFIADLYEKRFGRRSPETVLSVEAAWKASKAKALQKKSARHAQRAEADAVAAAARLLEADRAHGFSISANVSLEDGSTTLVEGDLAHRLSDALIEVMKPHIDFPPRISELHLLRAALEIGAEVWNATFDDDEVRRARTLVDIAARIEPVARRGPMEERLRFVIDVADRKRALHPNDERRVTGVNVEPKGRDVLISASSTLRRRRRAETGDEA